jgi:hypothetical protein
VWASFNFLSSLEVTKSRLLRRAQGKNGNMKREQSLPKQIYMFV